MEQKLEGIITHEPTTDEIIQELTELEISLMKILDITPETLKNVSKKELLSLHLRVHQLFNLFKSGKAKPKNITVEDLYNAHRFIVEEMKRRGITHNKVDPLDELLNSEIPLFKIFQDLPDRITLVRDFISFVGSSVNSGDFNDIDILVRLHPEYEHLRRAVKFRMVKAKPDIDKAFHFIFEPMGAHDNFVPLYDLVLVKRDLPVRVEMAEKKYYVPLKPFLPPKTTAKKFYFGDEEELIKYLGW